MNTGLSAQPVNFQIYNSQQSKRLAVVVDIPGLDYLTSTTIGRTLRYGDPFSYGDPGLLYGGLVALGTVAGDRAQKTLLDLSGGSLTIAQRLEPEQGRAAISTLSMSFIDLDQYMTQAISPGIIIDEILGKPVRIWLGYEQTSFPEDYYVVWRGRVAQTTPKIGQVTMQFVDPNVTKRQNVFYQAETTLLSDILATDTTINVAANGDFNEKILGPDGTWDQSIKCYIKINDEVIEYQQTGFESSGFGTNQFLNVARGARGTTPAVAIAGDTVDAFFELSGHAIDLALKVQLSGWDGPYLSDQAIYGLVQTGDFTVPTIAKAIITQPNVDAVRDLGLAVGDFIFVHDDPNPFNNGMCIVEGFDDIGVQTNRAILTNKVFAASTSSLTTIDLRSQYDTLPTGLGASLPGFEVDVAGTVFYKDTYLADPANSYRFYGLQEQACKTFIESEIMLPIGAYCLTRQGKLSMGLTKPPLADERTVELNNTNVLDPQNIMLTRAMNNRKYFNEIDWEFDFDDAGNAASLRKTIDTDSLSLFGLSSILPITSQGARTDLGFLTVVEDRERFLLLRYSHAAVLIDIKANFGIGNQIEAGDVIILNDSGKLQIPNLTTGQRNLGIQLFEVINRSLDIKTGNVQLQLEGGIGALINDRYATISPSSLITTGTTTSKIRITESFGAIFPAQEQNKWKSYVGLDIVVHSEDYTTRYGQTTFIGLDPSDDHAMLVNPPLAFTPLVGDIVEIAPYPNDTDPNNQALYKLIHCFLDPSINITSGVSTTSFNVTLGDAVTFNVGQNILVHNTDYSVLSDEVEVLSVVGTLVTVDSPLGFVPASGYTAELIGFKDGGGPYRLI